MSDTDRSPPPHDDEDPTPLGGRARVTPPSVVLGPEAMSDLLVRMVHAVEQLVRDVRGLRADVRIVLEEGRTHASRLTALEGRVAELERRPPPLTCGRPDCPHRAGTEAAE